MIDLYYWPTPNGHKITMFLEEAGLDYRIIPVDIGAGEQFKPEFLAISPNNRMPAIVDRRAGGRRRAALGLRIRRHLALPRREDRAVPADRPARAEDGSGVAVLAGRRARPDGGSKPPLRAVRAGEAALRHRPLRQRDEPPLRRARPQTARAAPSSPATTTRSPTWPAIRGSCRGRSSCRTSTTSRDLRRWFDAIRERPAHVRAYDKGKPWSDRPVVNEDSRDILFGQTAAVGASLARPVRDAQRGLG